MMGADMKYVTFDGNNGEQIIIFPKVIQHSVMAGNVRESSFGGMRPIAGGFIVNGVCVGRSESLMMDSRGDKDTALIIRLLDIEDYEEARFPVKVEQVTKDVISKNKAKRLRKQARK